MVMHLAALAVANGQAFEVQSRPTPTPGPGELLVAVKSVALNPADALMRNGLFIPDYPTVIGFDLSGVVLEVGEGVPTHISGNAQGVSFQPGITRIAAYAGFFWKGFDPNYGAFQEKCLIPWQHAVPLPSEKISWNHAATLPVAVQVPLSVWDAMGIPRLSIRSKDDASVDGTEGADKQEALLIWGASSSVGSMGVQSARLLRQDAHSSFAAVYATAGRANHAYIRTLGADRVFDYQDVDVVDKVISAAKADRLSIRHVFLAMGQIVPCQDILRSFLRQSEKGSDAKTAKIVSAPPIPTETASVKGIETTFIQPSFQEAERLEQFQYWFGTWLKENLAQATIRPSPEPSVVGRGLGAINVGLDRLAKGVSCTKLVIEIAD